MLGPSSGATLHREEDQMMIDHRAVKNVINPNPNKSYFGQRVLKFFHHALLLCCFPTRPRAFIPDQITSIAVRGTITTVSTDSPDNRQEEITLLLSEYLAVFSSPESQKHNYKEGKIPNQVSTLKQ